MATSIEYEIEFVNPKFAVLYGKHVGGVTGSKLGEPYAVVRKSLGGWIRDRYGPTGGAVPKFRFVRLVVDGREVSVMGQP